MAEAVVKSEAAPRSDLAERASAMMGGVRSLGDLGQLPLFRQLSLLIGVSLAVAAGLMLFFWSQAPGHLPVFQQLSPEDAGQLSESLRLAGIDFKVDPTTGNVTVPQDQVPRARMLAAQAGLPSNSGTGFELLQQEQGFGTSQFVESARYQLAIETELGRTISSLSPVRNARVHLALPKPSAFTQGRQPSSASVLVDLLPGASLDDNQVDAIEHLVASSVPNLDVSAVSIIDQHGRLLSDRDEGPDSFKKTDEQYRHLRRIESDLASRIRMLLTPMLGPDGVTAEVSASLDFSKVEEASERFAKEPVVRSEQTSEETRVNGNPTEGVPGALSNQPPETNTNTNATTNANGDVIERSTQATRNFELDRVVQHRQPASGEIQRLSVAVLVNYILKPDDTGALVPTALTTEELAKVESLVKQAVGFNEQRGDSVTVQNAPFVISADEAAPELPLWKRPDIQNLARQGLGALVVLVLIFAVVRPMLRALIAPTPSEDEDDEDEDDEDEDEEELDDDTVAIGQGGQGAIEAMPMPATSPEAIAQNAAYEHRIAHARQAVADDPKQVAQLIKGWLNEDG